MWKVFIYYTESVLLHKQTDTDKNNKTQQLSSSYDPINVYEVKLCPYYNHHTTTINRQISLGHK